ncbi:TPA: hypothetical protein LA460_000333 [Clostridium botulinum]|nr:hypothetical protein [Clostridium botulinum]HBJ1652937.1 hypothetical protein [Clostridium botulinum]
MLNELYEAIGKDKILEIIANKDSKGLYFRIPLDRPFNKDEDYLENIDKNSITPKNEKLFDWFKIRKMYSMYIESNKAIAISSKKYKFPKLIMTNQANAIIFNNKTILNKSEKYKYSRIEALDKAIKEFCEACNEKEKYNIYYDALEDISDIIQRQDFKIYIMLDIPLAIYKEKYNSYMTNKLFTEGTFKKDIGSFTKFATSNIEKIHLVMNSNIYNNKSAFNATKEEALALYNLNEYLKIRQNDTIEYKNGFIKYKCKIINKTDVVIDEYEHYPCKPLEIFEKKNLFIEDYVVDSADKFKYIIENIIGKIGGNDVVNFKTLYSKYYTNVNSMNINKFKAIYYNLIKNMWILGKRDYKDKYKLDNILKFNIQTQDYFFNTKLREEMERMKQKIEEKILNLKNTIEYKIENDEEYWYLIGTLASYLVSLSQSDSVRLKINYANVSNLKQVLTKLKSDIKRYGYKLQPLSRATVLYSSILNYESKNIKMNDINYNKGLFEIKNVIYTKLEDVGGK